MKEWSEIATYPGSSIARIPKSTLRLVLRVAFGNKIYRRVDCTSDTVRTISTPKARNVLIVTKVIKNDDIRGKEFPSISKAASGFSMIMAIVSKMEPAMVVTKKTFTT